MPKRGNRIIGEQNVIVQRVGRLSKTGKKLYYNKNVGDKKPSSSHHSPRQAHPLAV